MAKAEGLSSAAVKPVEAPLQLEQPFLAELLQTSRLVRVHEARALFGVDGSGTAIAVLDTGLRTTHRDFAGRVAAQRNFTADNDGDPGDATDGSGHGTNVAGIISAGGVHSGIAPAARIVPLKVLANDGSGSFESVAAALQWIVDNHDAYGITAVCLAFSDGANHQSDVSFANEAIGGHIKSLAEAGIASCVAAGDDYYTHGSTQGMSYPAILRETVSVGAIYDGDLGAFTHPSGAEAYETRADHIAPFSQRLHEKIGRRCATDIFAPGAPMTSSGILNDSGASIQHGASQATPVVAGVVLLLQSLHRRATGRLPAVADVRRWLIQGAATIVDADDEHDNVLHTGLAFSRVDAFAALEACARDIVRNALAAGQEQCADGAVRRHGIFPDPGSPSRA
ncbi:MAG TPA: S8 family serine peptidase [Allosphingosinicella sp.]|nr:S8 family serine peptidase [Allosphingosinicella sp.]